MTFLPHLLIGGAAASIFYKKNSPGWELMALQVAGAIGGILPDIPNMYLGCRNLKRGIDVFAYPGTCVPYWDTILHALIFWLSFLFLIQILKDDRYKKLYLAFAMGAILHSIGDLMSHYGQDIFNKVFWPLVIDWDGGLWNPWPGRLSHLGFAIDLLISIASGQVIIRRWREQRIK